MPVERVAMRQTWRHLTFLHWPYSPEVVQRLLPRGLQVDICDNAAWVGLIPFTIYALGGRYRFPETNVRTYVIGPDGSRAVWFFSLDAARVVPVIGARVKYRLPYFWANMQVVPDGGVVRYNSRRRWPHSPEPITDVLVEPRARFRSEELMERDHFLTARYRLYTVIGKRLGYAQIEHAPWPLARVNVQGLRQTLIDAAGLPASALNFSNVTSASATRRFTLEIHGQIPIGRQQEDTAEEVGT
jgi:uncharacterized protein